MGVAGIEVGMPSSIEEVDAGWLTKVFRASGDLSDSASVASVELEPFAVGLGFLSLLHRASMTYEGDADTAPDTVIVKMITDLEVQKGIAEALLFYQRELRFYTELAPNVGYRSPKAYAAMMAEGSSDFVLVLEELSTVRGLDQAVGVNAADAALSVETMAKMHGTFMGQDLSDIETTFLPFNNPVYAAVLPQIFASGWPGCKEHAADLLTPEIVAYGDRFADLVPFFMDQMAATTLIHGDWRADNLMVDDATGEMVIIDYQIMGTGPATYDLGYFMSQSLDPEVHNAEAASLVDRYFDALTATGAEFDRDELTRIYRLTNAWGLIYPVSTFAGWDEFPEIMQDTARRMLRRSISAIEHTSALELLPNQ